jgi:transposase-like protein
MGRIRRSFDIQFKIRVCEAIDCGEKTVLDICREFQIQRPVVESWLQKFVQGELEPKKHQSVEVSQAREIEKLRAKVGELTMQLDTAKKTLIQSRSAKNASSFRVSGGSSDLKGLRVKRAILLPAPTTTSKKERH